MHATSIILKADFFMMHIHEIKNIRSNFKVEHVFVYKDLLKETFYQCKKAIG